MIGRDTTLLTKTQQELKPLLSVKLTEISSNLIQALLFQIQMSSVNRINKKLNEINKKCIALKGSFMSEGREILCQNAKKNLLN